MQNYILLFCGPCIFNFYLQWNHGKLLSIGWSDTEELICVQDDALVFIYDMFGEEKESFSMGQEASLTKVNKHIMAIHIYQKFQLMNF